MTTIITRLGKGSPLTWTEADANFTNLNTDKAEVSVVNLKAPINSPNFTGTVSGVTSAMVGLGNVDNTSDATKNAATVSLTNKTITSTTNTVEATSGPNSSQLSFRNIIINGEVTRINQRNVANWAAVSNGNYGYDRWKKIDANNMTQIIESGNFKVNTTYTLSGTGVTTQQITSPASGNWTLPNIPITATNIQVEEGSKATPFEIRPIGLELGLCQRYYLNMQGVAVVYAGEAGAGQPVTNLVFNYPQQMRVNPTGGVVPSGGINVTGVGIGMYNNCATVTANTIAAGYAYLIATFNFADAEIP